MGDLSASDCSWKKMVLSKSENKWSSMIKSESIRVEQTMNTNSFSLNDDACNFPTVKVERDDDTSIESYEFVIEDASVSNEDDPLMTDNSDMKTNSFSLNDDACYFPSVKVERDDDTSIENYEFVIEEDASVSNEDDPLMTDNSDMNTNSFSLNDDACNFPTVKVERDDDTSMENYEFGIEEDASVSNEDDPLMTDNSDITTEAKLVRVGRRISGPKNETPEKRTARLARMLAYSARRRANETPEQRAVRLKRTSENTAKRLATESSDQRAKRLARESANAARRLASETTEQREARLARMSAYAARRQAMKKATAAIKNNISNLSDSVYEGSNQS